MAVLRGKRKHKERTEEHAEKEDANKVSARLIRHHVMKIYGSLEVQLHDSAALTL
jgi:hypothetical protein